MTDAPVAPTRSTLPPPAPPPPYPPPPFPPSAAGAQVRSSRGQSVTALVLGLCSILFFSWLVVPVLAVVFGAVAITAERRAGEPADGMAVAGVALGVLFTIIGALFWVAYLSAV